MCYNFFHKTEINGIGIIIAGRRSIIAMANENNLNNLRKSVRRWNIWRHEERVKESEAWEQYHEEYSDVISESDGPYYFPDEPNPLIIDLSTADFSGEDLSKVDFCGVNLQNTKFIKTKLIGAEFSGSNLNNADFSFANLSYADFSGAILDNTKFDSALCVGTKFDNKDLTYLKSLTFWPGSIDIDSKTHINKTRRLKVFLCHSSDDKMFVRSLYNKLCAEAMEPWLDEEKILPGQNWEDEIRGAVRSSDVVVVLLSNNSINKKGYVQKEIKIALDIADEQPEGSIFLIPVKIDKCEVPGRLSHLQFCVLSNTKGFDMLMLSLRTREKELGIIA